ncbi:MAG: SUMF1/EgtB/PvdO family nonheme iron enzyme, partial [Pseudomonadota bacterium]
GLYDMIGNAAEWVQDCDSLDYRDAPTDGRANERGMCGSRVARGGSWISGPRDFRLSSRAGRIKGDTDDTTGFRVALTLPPQ